MDSWTVWVHPGSASIKASDTFSLNRALAEWQSESSVMLADISAGEKSTELSLHCCSVGAPLDVGTEKFLFHH